MTHSNRDRVIKRRNISFLSSLVADGERM